MTAFVLDMHGKLVFSNLSLQMKHGGPDFADAAELYAGGTGFTDGKKGLEQAASLLSKLALLTAESHYKISSAAVLAHFYCSDRAGLTGKPCAMCSTNMHPAGIHGRETDLKVQDYMSGHLCGCYCQRGGK